MEAINNVPAAVTSRRRDLTIVPLEAHRSIVIACDSCGGIGEKEADVFHVPPFTVGAFTARTAFMEVLCAGCDIVAVVNNVCCEMNDTGAQIIKGVRHEMDRLGLPIDAITGSTEENFHTAMTAMGITAVGVADNARLMFRRAEKGDVCVVVGLPMVGPEVIENRDKIATYEQLRLLLGCEAVREVSPAGSKGVQYECETLAALNGLCFASLDSDIDMEKSAGPATCLVAVVAAGQTDRLKATGLCPAVVGQLI